MTSFDLNDWNINPDAETLAYHEGQWSHTYGSTKAFDEFASGWILDSAKVMDAGCGAGASTCYLADEYSEVKFLGVDVSDRLLQIARQKSKYIENVKFDNANLCQLRHENDIDGVISLQTFSWMRDIETPLHEICMKIKPRWLAFSSLFYEGDISCKIEVSEPRRPRTSFYNIYSIPRTAAFMSEYGYKLVEHTPYWIDVDLPQPDNINLMKTYTAPLEHGPRLQISGPLMLPWYFLAFEKKT